MRHYLGLCDREIAEATGCPVNAPACVPRIIRCSAGAVSWVASWSSLRLGRARGCLRSCA